MTLLDEWVRLAEADYKIATILNRHRKEPQPEGVCYHCQQSAEKYLKAILVSHGVAPPRTHKLLDWLADCAVDDSAVRVWFPLARDLDPFSVSFRYPGMDASAVDSETAMKAIRKLRRLARKKLGLK